MRKIFKIIFYAISFLFIVFLLFAKELNCKTSYIQIVYIAFLIPYMIYESIQLMNDDKRKGNSFLVNRLVLAVVSSVLLIILFIILK